MYTLKSISFKLHLFHRYMYKNSVGIQFYIQQYRPIMNMIVKFIKGVASDPRTLL